MKKLTVISLLILAIVATSFCFCNNHEPNTPIKHPVANNKVLLARLKTKATAIKKFAEQNNYNTSTCFLVDMSLPSGKNRFFHYDLRKDSIIISGLMAHGNCNSAYLEKAKFSNTPDCSCSSLGKYAIGYKYKGKFGDAYKLYGLDSSNSNAFKRFIVLHGYSDVPDKESTEPICNSLGCPMVSHHFFSELDKQIINAKKPILLWMFE